MNRESEDIQQEAAATDFSNTDTEQEISDTEIKTVIEETDPSFVAKDGETVWKKHIPVKNVRTRSENLVTRLPGVRSVVKNLKSLLEIWKYFFSDEVLDIIVENTNKRIYLIKPKYARERERR